MEITVLDVVNIKDLQHAKKNWLSFLACYDVQSLLYYKNITQLIYVLFNVSTITFEYYRETYFLNKT